MKAQRGLANTRENHSSGWFVDYHTEIWRQAMPSFAEGVASLSAHPVYVFFVLNSFAGPIPEGKILTT